jgi:hypothetical protein
MLLKRIFCPRFRGVAFRRRHGSSESQ